MQGVRIRAGIGAPIVFGLVVWTLAAAYPMTVSALDSWTGAVRVAVALTLIGGIRLMSGGVLAGLWLTLVGAFVLEGARAGEEAP